MGTTTGQLRLRTYRRFSDIPPRIAGEIISNLGLPGGKMRRRALRYDPRVIVAFERNDAIFDGPDDGELIQGGWWKPIAWLTLIRKRSYGNPHRAVSVFVEDEHRRQGIGKRMMKLCRSKWLRSSETVMLSLNNEGVKQFFVECGYK